CKTADRPGFHDREGVPGARGRIAGRGRPEAAATWVVPGRGETQARPGFMAERRPAAVRAARGPQAPDPAHVRNGRAEGHGAETRAQRPGAAGRPAARKMALPAPRRGLLRLILRQEGMG